MVVLRGLLLMLLGLLLLLLLLLGLLLLLLLRLRLVLEVKLPGPRLEPVGTICHLTRQMRPRMCAGGRWRR